MRSFSERPTDTYINIISKTNIKNGKSEKYFAGAPILGKAAVDESGITVALFDGRIVKF